jgi:hypothetical protein
MSGSGSTLDALLPSIAIACGTKTGDQDEWKKTLWEEDGIDVGV